MDTVEEDRTDEKEKSSAGARVVGNAWAGGGSLTHKDAMWDEGPAQWTCSDCGLNPIPRVLPVMP